METKSSIRKNIKTVISNIDNKQEQINKVCSKLWDLINSIKCNNILLFMPLPDEIDIIPFTKKLLKNNRNVFVPVSFDNGIMKFYRLESIDNLTVGKFNISEPSKKYDYIYNPDDLIIVPGVCFDFNFNRMGRGKGYYDIFLNKYPMKRIAVCFNEQILESIPTEEHDIKMDMIVSENKTLILKTL